MHTLYFAKIKSDKKITSLQARKTITYILDENNFASDSNGFYGSSKADWYVVGGRWSGLFTDKTQVNEAIRPLLKEELEKTPDLLDYLYINNHMLTEPKRKELDDIAISLTGLPYFRSSYDSLGYEDDAVIITKELLAKLKTEWGNIEVAYTDGDYIDDEGLVSGLDDDCIGDTLVIIDYHN